MSKDKDLDNLDKAALNALLSATPTAIHAKLDILKQALDNKTYTVNSERIAEELLPQDTSHSSCTKEIEQPETIE